MSLKAPVGLVFAATAGPVGATGLPARRRHRDHREPPSPSHHPCRSETNRALASSSSRGHTPDVIAPFERSLGGTVKRALAIIAAVVVIAGAFFLGVWAQYVHDQPLIQQGRQARVKADTERVRLTEAEKRTLTARRRAQKEEAEAERRQAQLIESLNGWHRAYSEPSGEARANDSAISGDFIPPSKTLGGHPTALCRDGTVSYSASRRGTCSHHGGVLLWYR
jgi:hypothetical protein